MAAGDQGCACGHPDEPIPDKAPPTIASPIILDLDGDGVETTTLGNGTHFDHDGNRFAEKTAWTGADDALLAWDRNNNGLIDDGSELFGNNFTMSNGETAANGFEALAEFDSNGDGMVDANDERWSELLLWQNRNGNGVVDDDEILTMEEAGVSGLNLAYQQQNYVDENGNQHLQSSSFIRDDGTVGQMTDVWFQTSLMDTKFLDAVDISAEVGALPNIKGWGNVADLHQVMEADETGRLQTLVEHFLDSGPIDAKSLVWDIIFLWTGVYDKDPASRGQYIGDARKIMAMEALTGQDIPQSHKSP